MRDIKFRVWDKRWNKMIYDVQDTFEENYTLGIDYFGQYLNNEYSFEVMQYTGLKDCNRKEIYEGDILNVSNKYSGSFQPIIIIFEDGCFKGQAYHKMTKPFMLDTPITVLEIIGNIYENKDLIK